MALEVGKLTVEPSAGSWTCDRRLALTEDRTRVVDDESVEARTLWATPGDVVPMSEALRLGAVTPEPEATPEPVVEPEAPADEPVKPAAKRAAKADNS